MTVAILGSEALDVTQIDVDSLRFGATGTENSIERGALLDGHTFEVTQEVEVTSSRPGRGGGKGGGRK